MTDHSLTLGSLLLTGISTLADPEHGFWFEVAAEGTEFGSPDAVTRIVTSLLSDGAVVSYDSDGNRVIPVRVRVYGPTLNAVAHGEAALRTVTKAKSLLTWQPPDVLAPPSTYETYPSPMARDYDGAWDLEELRQRVRTVRLDLTCSPFARSAEAVTVPALISGGVASTVLVDACDSTTGWAAGISPGGDTLSQSAGAVWATDSVGGNNAISLYRPAAIDVSAHPYFILEWKPFPGSGYTIMGMPSAPNQFPKELRRAALPDGWIRSYWLVEPGDLDTGFQLSYQNTDGTIPGDNIGIREVSKSNLPPGTTARQLTRIIDVGGTERTPASIHVQTATGTGSLGQCIVHTCPEDGSGYSPPLQRWRTVGQTRTNDATAFSGTYESINTTSWIAEVPTSALPEGGYVLIARLRAQSAATVTVTWSTSTIFPDAVTQEGFTADNVVHTFAAGNVWELVKMDALTLPSVRTKSGKVQIALQVAAASPVVTLDEAWLFREDDDCALTIVETARPQLWLESPDLDSSVPRAWIGDGLTTKVHPGTGLEAMGAHVLSPEGTAVFTAALADYPLTDATFYRRWHSNAAE